MTGIMDSGVGGLSVWKELIGLMPGEDFIYVSDGAFCPYGPKKPEQIIERVEAIYKFLITKGIEMMVIACNTATAAAIKVMREKYKIPFIGMEPAIKPAALQSRSGVVGVLATEGTFKGRLYIETLARFGKDVKVIERVGTGLVELVEKGMLEGPATDELVHKYMDPMIESGADYIVLGCTHYPFLYRSMKKVAGENVGIINPAPAVARRTYEILSQSRKVKDGKGKTVFYSTGETAILKRLAQSISGDCIDGNFNKIVI